MKIEVFGQTTSKVKPARTKFNSVKDFDSDTVSELWGQPQTEAGINFIKKDYKDLLTMTDHQLLNQMWQNGGLGFLKHLNAEYLQQKLESHFRGDSGDELTVSLTDDYWKYVNRIPTTPAMLPSGRMKMWLKMELLVNKGLSEKKWSNTSTARFNVSRILDEEQVSFRTDVFNPSLLIAMGGVQEVVIKTTNVKEVSYDSNVIARLPPLFPILSLPIALSGYKLKKYTITLEIKLRDWFGVDENDFAASEWDPRKPSRLAKTVVTSVGRRELAAFWILQHQRGYKPFVWNATFKTDITAFQLEKKSNIFW